MLSHTECPNCNQTLHGQYCSNCGQNQKSSKRYFLTLINEAFEGIFSRDSKVWRSTFYLWFRPGFLTNEHFANRRARYISPIRMYLVNSIGFFLILSLMNLFSDALDIRIDNPNNNIQQELDTEFGASGNGELPVTETVNNGIGDVSTASSGKTIDDDTNHALIGEGEPSESRTLDPVLTTTASPTQDPTATDQSTDAPTSSSAKALTIPTLSIEFPYTSAEQSQALSATLQAKLQLAVDIATESPERILDQLIEIAPPVVFVLLPLFALVLKVFYLGSSRYYTEHLILAIHNHSFLFSAITVLVISPLLLPAVVDGFLSLILFIWIGLYMLLSLKRVYQQSWSVTIIKYGLLLSVYGFLVGFGFLTMTVIGLMLL